MKRRRGYLKHFNDATIGESIQSCLLSKNYLTVLVFWHVLEKCNQKESDTVTFEISSIARTFHVKKDKISRELERLSEHFSEITWRLVGDLFEISVSNYREYQERRGKKPSRKAPDNDAINDDIKDKRLKIEDNNSENESDKNLTNHKIIETDKSSEQLTKAKVGDENLIQKPSPAQIQEVSFNAEAIEQIREILDSCYGDTAPGHRRRMAARILFHFQDAQSFATWANGVINGKNCPDPKTHHSEFDQYFGKALSNIFGSGT